MFEGITQGISAAEGLNFMLVFLEGVLSFFSPCVIPVIPVYMSYLTAMLKLYRKMPRFHINGGRCFFIPCFLFWGYLLPFLSWAYHLRHSEDFSAAIKCCLQE